VDITLFTLSHGRLMTLLIRRKHDPYAGRWAFPGGFVDMDEDLVDAARRELEEETGVAGVALEQLRTFGALGRDPRTRVITVAYMAFLDPDQARSLHPRGGDDAAEARWWDACKPPPLAFDHDQILNYALEQLRAQLGAGESAEWDDSNCD
jgi:8-oxo-dGTP diphosphatase